MLLLQSVPHPALQKYIGQYFYISFHSSELPSLKQTFLPYDIPNLSFFVGQVSLEYFKSNVAGPTKTSISQSVRPVYVGLVTSPISLYFGENQVIKGFMVVFKPAGFSSMFRQDMAELTNQMPDFSSLAGVTDATHISEEMLIAPDFTAQIKIMDAFFLRRISNHSLQAAQITEACRRLNFSNGLERMTDLAYHTNMSLRNLERQFTERVGVSPKLFARFKRFHRALTFMSRPKPLAWANIAQECGYYDQAHFIKEFKVFAHHTPSVFSPAEYLLFTQFILFPPFANC